MLITDMRVGNNLMYLGMNCDVLKVDYSDGTLDLYNGNHYTGIDFEDVEPIELTVLELVRMGYVNPPFKSYFTPSEGIGKHHAELRLVKLDKEKVWHVSIGDDDVGVIFKRIHYIHELQNIHYLIYEKEITITNL